MIILSLMMIFPVSGSEKKWNEMTDQEQWEILQAEIRNAEYFRTAYHKQKEIIADLRLRLSQTNQSMKQDQSFIPKYGIAGGFTFLMDQQIEPDLNIHVSGIFFLLPRLYVSPTITVKVYKNIGGGAGISFGVLF